MITSMTSPARLSGGIIDDLEREDDRRGPERDETDQLCSIRVRQPHPGQDRAVDIGRIVLPGNLRAGIASHASGGQQCAICQGWFGVTVWTCPACQSIGYRLTSTGQAEQVVMEDRPPLPMRPTPHERDGREQSPSEARPHPRAPH
ncbi:hypothetical protein [Streptomyces sp. 8N706]|uniref:hypothetical protein n=1 Tax=Streptomyces sp. 8N706 TaxID=3457416 RepID=UPI003FD6641B